MGMRLRKRWTLNEALPPIRNSLEQSQFLGKSLPRNESGTQKLSWPSIDNTSRTRGTISGGGGGTRQKNKRRTEQRKQKRARADKLKRKEKPEGKLKWMTMDERTVSCCCVLCAINEHWMNERLSVSINVRVCECTFVCVKVCTLAFMAEKYLVVSIPCMSQSKHLLPKTLPQFRVPLSHTRIYICTYTYILYIVQGSNFLRLMQQQPPQRSV